MSTNRPTQLLANRFTLRHNTGNGLVGISANLTSADILALLREYRKQGDRRNFVITDAKGNVVAHAEP